MIRKAYHYMPLKYYLKAKEEGVLRPTAQLVPSPFVSYFGLEIPRKRFKFCFLDTPEPESWVESGWLDRLKKRQGGLEAGLLGKFKKGQKQRYAIVSFNLSPDDEAYVFDATGFYEMADNYMRLKGKSIFSVGFRFLRSCPHIRDVYQNYLDSMTPLHEYQDDFVMSEVAVAKEIPFSELTLERICELEESP